MTKDEFIKTLNENGLALTNSQLESLDTYAEFLVEYNKKVNLTAITEYEEILDKHFYDSLLFSFDKKVEGTLIDVGTGAGFPGVVLKICYPNLKVILVEPIKKRCVFLNELIQKLNLTNIEVVNSRGEDYTLTNREKYDFVTARAVSKLNELIEVCGGLVKLGGYFVVLKGSNGENEITDAKNAISKMGFEVEKTYQRKIYDGSLRTIAFLKKNKQTPKTFPRKYSIIKTTPL